MEKKNLGSLRVLLVGNANLDDYLYSLIRNVHEASGIEFDLLTEDFSRSSRPLGLNRVFSVQRNELRRGFWFWPQLFRGWLSEIFSIRERSFQYEWINLHYVAGSPLRVLVLVCALMILQPRRGLLLSFWGADLNEETKNPFRRLVILCLVTFSSRVQLLHPSMLSEYERVFGPSDQIMLARLALPLELNRPPAQILDKFREVYGLEASRFTVVVGYSADPLQRHHYIINELQKTSDRMMEQIQVIVPLTYGQLEYADKLEKWIGRQLKCPVIVLRKRLSDLEVMALRTLTDLQINIQAHDGLSAAIREVLYFGGIVMNGAWLPYQEIRDRDIVEIKVTDLSEGTLQRQITEVFNHRHELKLKAQKNKDVIEEIYSWKYNVNSWLNVYRS